MTDKGYSKTFTVLWSPRTSRRVAAFCLVLAWSAFWLMTSLLPCCKFPLVQDHAITASAIAQTTGHDHHGRPDYHPPDNSKNCTDIVITLSTEVSAVHSPLAGEHAIYAHFPETIPEWPASLGLNYAISLPLAPPRSIPFHLRTSRILV